MISLAIGDIRNNPDYAWLHLHGEPLITGLLGSIYEPKPAPGDVVEERINLAFKGTPAQIASVLRRLEDMIWLGNRFTHEGVGHPHYLRLKYDDSGIYYYTRLLHARMDPAPNSLSYYAQGSLGVDLIFTRPNYFDGEETALPISNSNGANVTTGLTLYNHDDSSFGHDNFFFVDAIAFNTELPAPIKLELTNTTSTGVTQDILVGSYQYNALSGHPLLIYEGESSTGGTNQSDSNSSGGSFKRLSWSATAWSSLLTWTVSASNTTKFQGRAVLPVIRLANTFAYTDLQLRIVISSGGLTLYQGAAVHAEPSRGYMVFPPIRLPASVLSRILYAKAHELSIQALKISGASYTVDVDTLHLFPLDSFSHYQAMVPLSQTDRLIDDAFAGVTHAVQSDNELATHTPLRQGHFLSQAHSAYFHVLQTDASHTMPIARTLSAKAWYRERKRIV